MAHAPFSNDGERFANRDDCKYIKLLSADPVPSLQFGLSTTLTWLSHVHTSHVPLHQIVGPSYDCITDDAVTETWLTAYLLGHDGQSIDPSWWTTDEDQSDTGLVFKAENVFSAWEGGPTVTEILLYAVRMPKQGVQNPSIVSQHTPSFETKAVASDGCWRFRVRALPLSGELHLDEEELASIPLPQVREYVTPAAPLLKPHFACDNDGPKKSQLTSLFERAACQNKRFKDKGGDSVARAMAKLDGSSRTPGTPVEQLNGIRSPLSWESPLELPLRSENKPNRPSDHRVSVGKTKNTSRTISTDSPGMQVTGPDGPHARNKTALQRAVLTGMRLYGLQQKKRPHDVETASGIKPEASGAQDEVLTDADDEEFKLVYHQTYKAAAFAFRRQFASATISQEDVREIVDNLLTLFCHNPCDPFQASENRKPFASDYIRNLERDRR